MAQDDLNSIGITSKIGKPKLRYGATDNFDGAFFVRRPVGTVGMGEG